MEPGMDCRLSTRELDCWGRHRLLRPEDLQHADDGVVVRLENVSRLVRVREADRALEVAPVREIDVRQSRVAQVQVAQSAIERAILRALDRRVNNAHSVLRPLLNAL